MVNRKKLGVFVILLVFFSLCYLNISYSINEDNIKLIRIDSLAKSNIYSKSEPLIFEVDIPNSQNIDAKIVCKETPSVSYNARKMSWYNGSFLFSYLNSDITCDNYNIVVTFRRYDETLTIKKGIKIENYNGYLSDILNMQQPDGGYGDPINTAYAILALKQFDDTYNNQIDDALEWLKENRNDYFKCWPKSSCNTKITAKILYLLLLSKVEDKQRIVHDAQYYLERHQKEVVDENWLLYVEPEERAICVVDYKDVTTTYNISLNSNLTITIKPAKDKTIDVTCDEDANFELYINKTNETIAEENSQDNFFYEIEDGCFSEDKWTECDIETTTYAILGGIEQENVDKAKVWLDSKLQKDSLEGKFFESEILGTSLYVYKYPDETEMLKWLLFKQNNDGSWGASSNSQYRILETGTAMFAITKAGILPNSENIIDGKNFLFDHKSEDLKNIEDRSLILVNTVNNIRPVLTMNPAILELDSSEKKVEFYNPSTRNFEKLSINFSDEIKPYVSYNTIEDLLPDSHTYVIFKKNESAGKNTYYGHMDVQFNKTSITRYPILIISRPTISLEVPTQKVIFGKKDVLNIPIKKIDEDFICNFTIENKDFISNESVKVSKGSQSIPYSITYPSLNNKQTNYTGKINCSSGESIFGFKINLNIKRYSNFPFTLNLTNKEISSLNDELKASITNNLNERQTVFVDTYFLDETLKKDIQSIILNPNETKEVDLFIVLQRPNESANFTKFDKLKIKSSSDYEQEVPLSLNIIYEKPGVVDMAVSGTVRVFKIIFFTTLTIIILFIIYVIIVKTIIKIKINQIKNQIGNNVLDVKIPNKDSTVSTPQNNGPGVVEPPMPEVYKINKEKNDEQIQEMKVDSALPKNNKSDVKDVTGTVASVEKKTVQSMPEKKSEENKETKPLENKAEEKKLEPHEEFEKDSIKSKILEKAMNRKNSDHDKIVEKIPEKAENNTTQALPDPPATTTNQTVSNPTPSVPSSSTSSAASPVSNGATQVPATNTAGVPDSPPATTTTATTTSRPSPASSSGEKDDVRKRILERMARKGQKFS